LPRDASIRIAIQSAPFTLHVLLPDGSAGATIAPIASAGLALGAIPQGGTYTLKVQTAGNWGITIVFFAQMSSGRNA
jgi:hypothetical protein